MIKAKSCVGILSVFLASVACLVPIVASADIIDGKYGVNQVFDVQRSPAFPVAGQNFTLSNFSQPFADAGGRYNIGTGYIQFFYVTNPTGNDLVGINLLDQNGNILSVASPAGSIYGLETDGFLYVSQSNGFGTFVSNSEGFNNGDTTTYVTSTSGAATLAQLQGYNATTTVLGPGQTAGGAGGAGGTLEGATDVLKSFASGGAEALDTFSSTSPDPAVAAVADALGNLTTAEEKADAVAQTLPVLTGATPGAVINIMDSVTKVVQARNDSVLGLSSGDDFATSGDFWLKPFGSWSDQDNKNGIVGYSADTYGVVAGVDSIFFDDLRLGIAGSYGNTDVDSNDGRQNLNVNTYQAIFYGSYSVTHATEVNFQVDGGYNTSDASRDMDFGGLNETATADYDGWNLHLGAGIGHSFDLTTSTTLLPSARIDYAYVENEGYREKGAGALNLNVASQDADQLILSVAAKLRQEVGDNWALEANLGVGYDVLTEETSVASSYVGGGGSFVTRGNEPSAWILRSGAGVSYDVSDSVSLKARYDREDRGSDLDSQTASLNIRLAF